MYASYIMMRLPYAVKELFTEWVEREFPDRASKVLNRIRDIRDGNLSDPRFHSRMRGEGQFADAIANLFEVSCKKYHIGEDDFHLSTKHFQRPGQISLF